MAFARQFVLSKYAASDFDTSDPITVIEQDTSNTVERASVTGLFITISFCIIVQPFGSLLYAKPRGFFNRSIFFFWRLNPLACGVEALLIFLAFFDSVWSPTWRLSGAGLWEDARLTATAVLLLRSRGSLPEHWKALTSTTEGQNSNRHSEQREARAKHADDESTSPVLGDDRYSDNASPASSLDISDRATILQVAYQHGGPSTSAYEQHGRTSPRPGSIRSIGSARANLVGRQSYVELTVKIFGTIAVLIVILKLAVVVIPSHIQAAAWCMALGWSAVQVLVLLSYRSDRVDPRLSEYLIRRAVHTEARLHGYATQKALSWLLLPLLGYIAFAMLFRCEPLSRKRRLGYVCFGLFYYVLLNPTVGRRLREPLSQWDTIAVRGYSRRIRSHVRETDIAGRGRSLPLSIRSYALGVLMGWCLGRAVSWYIVYDPESGHRLKGYMILPSLVGTVTLYLWFFLPGTSYAGSFDGSEWCQGVSLFYNLAYTFLVLVRSLETYDSTGTYKPGWLDWLGRRKE